MAVKSVSTWRRTSLIALAMAALSLPAMAQAAPEQGREWGNRVSRDGDDSPRHQRQAAPQQRREAPVQQQRSWSPPPQAQGEAHAAPQARWNQGAERAEGNRRNSNRSWAPRPAQAAPQAREQQAVQTGSSWRERAQRADSVERTSRGGDWNNRRSGGNWQAAATAPERRAEGDRRLRDGDRARNTQYRSNGDDWRSRVQRSDRDRSHTDRSYWRDRNWSNHWDGSRRNRWSGWNNNWDWTAGSSYNRWNTRWRSNNRYDWLGWRNHHPSYYQVGYYYAPYRSYSYRRLSIGFFLDALFFGQDYWIADPWYYRLPEAYGPYRWVRYYDDAVLVNIYSGEVADVIHDFFW